MSQKPNNALGEGGASGAELARRRLLRCGLSGLGLMVLAGCAGGRARGATPGVLWPDERPTAVLPESPMVPFGASRPAPPIVSRAPAPAAPVSGVMGRSSWTRAQPNQRLADPMNGIARITVHHDGMPPESIRSQGEAASRIEQIRRSHVQRGWADIGYHYVIDPQGRVWEGRPLWLQGAHVQDNNPNNLGILVLGNFDQQQPTGPARDTLDRFLYDQMARYRVPMSRVYTHQELKSTACPGRNLQRYMLETRSRSGRLGRMVG